jgi:hypothetical protein
MADADRGLCCSPPPPHVRGRARARGDRVGGCRPLQHKTQGKLGVLSAHGPHTSHRARDLQAGCKRSCPSCCCSCVCTAPRSLSRSRPAGRGRVIRLCCASLPSVGMSWREALRSLWGSFVPSSTAPSSGADPFFAPPAAFGAQLIFWKILEKSVGPAWPQNRD